jgi:opacity protein-like surface antigen
MKYLSIFLAIAMGTLAGQASAAGHAPGWYFRAFVGFVDVEDIDSKTPAAPGTVFETEHDGGWGVGGAIGYDFGMINNVGLRIEGELGYRSHEVDDHRITGPGAAAFVAGVLGGIAPPPPAGALPTGTPIPGSRGDTDVHHYLINLLVDLRPGQQWNPYIGAGIGGANVDYDGWGVGLAPRVLDDDDTAFAWQFIAGLELDLGSNWFANAEYRYFDIDGTEIQTLPTVGVVNIESEYSAHNFNVGVRKAF